MESNQEVYIPVSIICEQYQIEPSFIEELCECGLMDMAIQSDMQVISGHRMRELEQMIHFRYELDINIAGIEAIINLLERVENLQVEVKALRNQLQRWE